MLKWPRDPWNALHRAAQDGSTERTVSLLASTGSIDINAGTSEGFTPLMISSVKGFPRVTRVLLNRGADTSVVDELFTELHMSSREGWLEVTKIMVKAGARPWIR